MRFAFITNEREYRNSLLSDPYACVHFIYSYVYLLSGNQKESNEQLEAKIIVNILFSERLCPIAVVNLVVLLRLLVLVDADPFHTLN